MSADFYVTLPSNASKTVFPSNKLGEFTVKLQNTINTSLYEVGLAEVQYPSTWLTTKDAYFHLTINGTTYKADMLDARYLSFEKFVEAFNNLLRNYHVGDGMLLHYDEHTMHASLIIRSGGMSIKLNKQLCTMLGFKTDKTYTRGTHKGEYVADLDCGMTALYMYCNLVSNQLVGDASAPLLRTIPLRGNPEDTYRSEEFRHVRYLPMIESITDSIKILIRRDTGEEVPFTSGKVIVTLHFRPKK